MTLHRECVPPGMWEQLLTLMQIPEIQSFYLVGGTALALRMGHRESVDIDLFTGTSFDSRVLAETLRAHFQVEEIELQTNTLRCRVQGVKLECISHQYPLLNDLVTLDTIRMASLEDLAAFKANAISNRGSKKDFWDVHALLARFSLKEIFQFCEQKYAGESLWNLEKSLVYFDDADQEPEPMDRSGLDWNAIKARFVREISEFRRG